MKRLLIASCVLVLLLAGAVWAQAPNTILYQGRFTDDAGAPLVAPVMVTFTIWDQPVDGVSWSSGELTLDDTMIDDQGMFSIELGPLGIAEFTGAQRWLEIEITGEAAMTPRQLITSVPYAVSAGRAGGVVNNAINSNSVQNGTLQDIDLMDEPGVASNSASNSVTLGSTPINLTSRNITIPAPGYVVAMGDVFAAIDHTNGGGGERIDVSISQTSGTVGAGEQEYLVSSSMPTGYFFSPMHVQEVYYYSTAGSKTIYLVGESDFGTLNFVRERHLILMYFPTNYGTVNPYSVGEPQESTTLSGQ